MITDLLHARQYRANDDGGGGGDDDAQAAADAQAAEAAKAKPEVTPLTPDSVNAYLQNLGYAALPVAEYQALIAKKDAVDPHAAAAYQEEMAQLALSDPAAFAAKVTKDATAAAKAEAGTEARSAAQESRDLANIPNQIMRDVRAEVKGLPESEYEKLEAMLYDPKVTAQQLRDAKQSGYVTNLASKVKLKMYEEGTLVLDRSSRQPNSAGQTRGETVADHVPTGVKDGAAKMLAIMQSKGIAATDEDLKGSSYFPGAKK